MAPRGLEHQIAGRFSEPASAKTDGTSQHGAQHFKLVGDLARALTETAETAASLRHVPARAAAIEANPSDQDRDMPQVLRAMGQPASRGRLHRSRRHLSPLVLTLLCGGFALAAIYVVTRVAGLQDFAVLDLPQQPLSLTTGFAPIVAYATEPEMTFDDRQLLKRSAAFVALGDFAAARTLLAHAAAAGNPAARFALAETFDPNTLAAWGARDPVADVILARTFYEQALASGDARAERRIEALTGAR